MLCPYCLNDVVSFEKIVDPIRSAIAYTCPKCPNDNLNEIPLKYVTADEQIPKVLFSLIGKTGHGKTCFLSSLLHNLDNASARWPDFTYQALDEIEFSRVRATLERIGRGDLPTGTSTTERPRPLLLELQSVPLVGACHLLLYDVGGAVFDQVSRVHDIAPFVVRSSAVIWLLSLSDLDARFDLDEFLAVYLNALKKLSSDPSKQTLILSLTKGDQLLNRQDLPESVRNALLIEIEPSKEGWSQMLSLSSDIESWLETSCGFANFVRQVRREFRHVRYCVNSALGSNPSGGNQMEWSVQPRGVLLPLWWVLHDSLPKVKVVTDDGQQRQFFSIDSAIAEAMKNARVERIVLESGEYRLQRPITFRRPMQIVGQSSEATRLVCNLNGFVAKAELPTGGGSLGLSRLTFEHQGNTPADVFLVRSGRVIFKNCEFIGGKREPKQDVGGVGLRVEGGANVDVHQSVASNNDWFGILSDGNARIRIKKCKTNQNGQSGICFSGKSTAELSACECFNNVTFGIEVRGWSESRISDSHCESNGAAGIAYFDHAIGDATANLCRENKKEGIRVHDTTVVELERNRCEHNRDCGIRFSADSRGTADGNLCDDNGNYGIEIGADARPTIVSAECRRNGKIGILVNRGHFSLFNGTRVGGWQCHENGEYEFVDMRDAWSRFFFGNRVSKVPSSNGRSTK